MSLAGAPISAEISLAATARQALPRRLLALIVDTLVISVLEAIVNGAFGVTQVTGGFTQLTSGGVAVYTTQTVVAWPWLTLLWLAYYAILEALFAASLGKLAAGLRVTDLEGRRVSWQKALIRNLVRPLDAVPFLYLLGGVLVLISGRHQRLGDRVAGTLVLPTRAVVSAPLAPRTIDRRAIILGAITIACLAFCAWFAYYGRPPLVIEGAKNTSEGIFNQGVSSYTLGTPRWGPGTVTYPITYETARTNQTCDGLMTLHWNWFIVGWVFSGGSARCGPRLYP
jgi:uncharacterized RDD family membrane protein YckC